MMNYDLLKKLCAVRASAGNEIPMKDFLLDYLQREKSNWKVQPQVIVSEELGDGMIWIFGKPKTAVYAHLDSVAFTLSYDNYLVPVGSPDAEIGDTLCFEFEQEVFTTKLVTLDNNDHSILIDFPKPLPPGLELYYSPEWKETDKTIQSCYLDNRVGVYTLLRLCETVENAAFAFTCYEEMGGGNASVVALYLLQHYGIRSSLICDVTWESKGVHNDSGVVLSLRDSKIPRKLYVDKLTSLAKKAEVPFQFEVEGHGGSDGSEIQKMPYAIDWMFIGPPIQNMHSLKEIIHKSDLESTISLYSFLLNHLP